MGAPLDHDKLAMICGQFGSEYDGVRATAAAQADKMLKRAGTNWNTILSEAAVATAACEQLLAELTATNARVAEFERAQPDWAPVERVTIGNHNRAAKWLIHLGDDSKIWLSAKERSFLGTCAAWIGPLRPKQQPFLQSIVDRVHKQYGFAPPP